MAKRRGGWAGKLLRVDLTSGKLWTEPSIEYGEKYIGGRGLGARIGWDEIPAGTGPFDPENRIVFAAGPLTGTSAPNSGRATVCSLSPQAYPYEWFTYSSFGGYWGPTLKYAGYDAIVVQGQAERPVYLWVNDSTGGRAAVELRDARDLWGQGIYATQETLLRRHGTDVRVLAIGQAGENRSRIAIIASGTTRPRARAASAPCWAQRTSRPSRCAARAAFRSPSPRRSPTVRWRWRRKCTRPAAARSGAASIRSS